MIIGNFTFKTGDSLRNLLKEIPARAYGIYIMRVNDEIVYIGKAGTVITDGSVKRQGLRQRLAAARKYFSNGQQFFEWALQELHTNEIDVEWRAWDVVAEKLMPALVENQLINDFYQEFGRLPKLNAGQ